MTIKFNFLDRRTKAAKAAAELRRKYPKRSDAWITTQAQQIAGIEPITHELRAPEAAAAHQRSSK